MKNQNSNGMAARGSRLPTPTGSRSDADRLADLVVRLSVEAQQVIVRGVLAAPGKKVFDLDGFPDKEEYPPEIWERIVKERRDKYGII